MSTIETTVDDLPKRMADAEASPPPEGWVMVSVEFVRGFLSLAHNYSLSAIPPVYYDGIAGDAFKCAYRRCGDDLAALKGELEASGTIQPAPQPAAVAVPSDGIPIEDAIAWQETGTGVERKAVTVSGRAWYRDDHPRVATQAARQPAAVAGPVGLHHCPITGRKFWGNIEHPELGLVATYGGPFDTYTIPAISDDGELRCERFDQDAGHWVEGGEPAGWLSEDQPDAAPTAQPSPQRAIEVTKLELTPADAEQLEKAITDFEGCGETDVPDKALQRFAAMGYLECTHYNVLPAARAAIDAASAQQEGTR